MQIRRPEYRKPVPPRLPAPSTPLRGLRRRRRAQRHRRPGRRRSPQEHPALHAHHAHPLVQNPEQRA
ncbi:putative 2',3'-cyclic-nucleotide 2'-phosphodiesterase [Streptomyces sp. Tu6071]|nr:putative 2',3'-cyclic-nucleotide 2'-phosphodiesterase [Streptomyces sp. Tu6071]